MNELELESLSGSTCNAASSAAMAAIGISPVAKAAAAMIVRILLHMVDFISGFFQCCSCTIVQ